MSEPVAVPASLPKFAESRLRARRLLPLFPLVLVEKGLRRRVVGRLLEQGRDLTRVELLLRSLGFLLGLFLLFLLQLCGFLLLGLVLGFLLLRLLRLSLAWPAFLSLWLLRFVGLALFVELLFEKLLLVRRRTGRGLRRRWCRRRLVDLFCYRVWRAWPPPVVEAEEEARRPEAVRASGGGSALATCSSAGGGGGGGALLGFGVSFLLSSGLGLSFAFVSRFFESSLPCFRRRNSEGVMMSAEIAGVSGRQRRRRTHGKKRPPEECGVKEEGQNKSEGHGSAPTINKRRHV